MPGIFASTSFQSFIVDWFSLYSDTVFKGTIVLMLVSLLVLIRKKMSPEIKHLLLFISIFSFIVLLALSAMIKLYPPQPNFHIEHQPFIKVNYPTEIQSIKQSEINAVNQKTSLDTSSAPDFLSKAMIVLFCIWVLGFVLYTVRILIGIGATFWIKKKSHLVDEDSKINLLSELKHKIGLNCCVKIYEKDSDTSPVTAGIFSPYIILPYEHMNWDYEHYKAVLLHELFHIKRHDNLTQLIARFICAVFWINPLVWIVEKSLRSEREYICDESVINTGIKPHEYAGQLLEAVKSLPCRNKMFAFDSPMAHILNVEKRILKILSSEKKQNKTFNLLKTFAVFAILLLSLFISTLNILAAGNSSKNGVASVKYSPDNLLTIICNQPYINIKNASPDEIPTLLPLAIPGGISPDAVKVSNNGIDITKDIACYPIVASADGKVIKIEESEEYGGYIILQHKYGLTTFYGPIYETSMTPGQAVKKGDIIAYSYGITKVHFEIRADNLPLNPEAFISSVK